MPRQIYYYFWCLEKIAIPYVKKMKEESEKGREENEEINSKKVYDIENKSLRYHERHDKDEDVKTFTEANENDIEFIRYFRNHGRRHEDSENADIFTFELLSVYLSVNHNEQNPNSNYENALIWVNHTIDILSDFGEDYTFITENVAKFLEEFEPKKVIPFHLFEDNKLSHMRLSTKDDFFSNCITVNINIYGDSNSPKMKNEKEETIATDKNQKDSYGKVKIFVLLELLKKLGVNVNTASYKDIYSFISMISGNTENYVESIVSDKITFTKKTHLNQVNRMNQLLENLKLKIKLTISDT